MAVLGIMGGSFDPVHNGHVQMAMSAMKQMRLDGVLWIPAGDPPHKSRLTPARHRLRMVRLATEGIRGFQVSDIELRRARTTYTVDTLTELRRAHPGHQYVYIIGADTLFQLTTWHTFELVPPMLRAMAVVPRPCIAEADVRAQMRMLHEHYHLQTELIAKPGPDISSTDIRMRVERALPIEGLVPPRVAEYIRGHRLYQDEMLSLLRKSLTPDRYRHTLGVEGAALKLAAKNGVDPGKARVAALLHDCAKCIPEREMAALLESRGQLPPRRADRTTTLMHAKAGVILARERYGVTDPEILSAIRWHTTGHAGMTKLEKLIYLADVIEPGRRPFPALSAIRAATERSLDEGMKVAAERTLMYLSAKGIEPDPHTLEVIQDIKKQEELGT